MFIYKLEEFDYSSLTDNFHEVNKYQSKLTIIDMLKKRQLSSCPHCNCKNIIKYGKYNGLQRYKCLNKICKKTFSQKTKTLFSYSKKPIDLWIKYFILLINGKSLRDCASILNINLATAFFWRHKILFTQRNNYYNVLKNYVEISKVMLLENFKGDRNAKNNKKEKIFIACAIDSNKTLVAKVISRYTISINSINTNFSYNIDKNAILSSYNDRYFEIYSSRHNSNVFPIKNKQISIIINELKSNNLCGNENSNIDNIKKLNLTLPRKCLFVHSFSLNIRRWLFRFKGVATKYIENYLNWYMLDYKNNYKTFSLNQINLFKKFLNISSFIKIKDFSTYNLMFKK